MEAHLEWVSPSPFWLDPGDPASEDDRRRFRTPAILRFASDEFMDEYLSLLAVDPASLRSRRAQWESWRDADTTPAAPRPKRGLVGRLERWRIAAERRLEARSGSGPLSLRSSTTALTLYQPAHMRYYLVTACLVCRIPGLPDRLVDASRQEEVNFVLRRVSTIDGSLRECAFNGKAWTPLADPTVLGPNEEKNPLSPTFFEDTDRRRRRIFSGLIPVGRRDAYYSAPTGPITLPSAQAVNDPTWPDDVTDPRQILLRTQVSSPWDVVRAMPNPNGVSAADFANRVQLLSWYVLLDFSDYLEHNVPRVFAQLPATGSANGLTLHETALWTALDSITSTGGATLRQALVGVRDARAHLEGTTSVFDGAFGTPWPSVRFSLQAVTWPGTFPVSGQVYRLERLVAAALDTSVAPPPNTAVADLASIGRDSLGDDLFLVRCVFERPLCGGVRKPVVSDASERFRLAAFFEPEAPARPIRITLPLDTTPAGLRRFSKNTAFVMSDVLCGQVKAVSNKTLDQLSSIGTPTPCAGSGGLGLGMVCSLSIPIITICALILLMIIVVVLNLVFWWLPFFKICLPLPGAKAK